MTNEWKEFQDYISVPEYKAESKKDTSYLGRMLIDIFADFKGLERILTILARGYLFHDPDGCLKEGDPYERTDLARSALRAWCSIPDSKGTSDPPVDFRKLYGFFPELVNAKGAGWFYRHEKQVIRFIRRNPTLVKKDVLNKSAVISKSFTANWKKKVRQFQVSVFTPNTKALYGFLGNAVASKTLDESILLNGMKVKCNTDFATIALSSLTDDPIQSSDCMLLSTIGRSRSKGAQFDGEKLLDFGTGPIEVEVIDAEIAIRTDREGMRVWSVNSDGYYVGQIPKTYEDGWLKFHVGPNFAGMYYLIMQE